MSYIVNNSRGQIIAVIPDGTINTTSTCQTLVGKNVAPYGEYEVENLVHQLENFANSSPPGNPILGQLWYDTSTGLLKVYTGTTWGFAGGLGVVQVPTHSYGVSTDVAGLVAFDSTYMYYCTAPYVNNSTNIWKRVAWSGSTW
jgi:hypothetical protein